MPCLLAIDDNPNVLHFLGNVWSGNDIALLTAETAGAGLDLLREKKPDVVLMDIGLPDMSGLDAYQRFRTIDPHVPIIFMTGDDASDLAIEATRLGAYDYVL